MSAWPEPHVLQRKQTGRACAADTVTTVTYYQAGAETALTHHTLALSGACIHALYCGARRILLVVCTVGDMFRV